MFGGLRTQLAPSWLGAPWPPTYPGTCGGQLCRHCKGVSLNPVKSMLLIPEDRSGGFWPTGQAAVAGSVSEHQVQEL
eukprot:12928577-Prorocentrum_lima.AAC.1